MGFFADKFDDKYYKEKNSQFLKNIDDFVDRGHPALMGREPNLTPTYLKEAWDILGSTTLNIDPCNITLFTKYGMVNYRNPKCQPPPPPPPPPPPTPKGDDCVVLYCRDGSIISTVISERQGTTGNPGGFPPGTAAQTVLDYNYNKAISDAAIMSKGLNQDAANGTTRHPLVKNIRTIVEPFGQEGFAPQTQGLAIFQIAKTTDEITIISDDKFITLDNPPTRLSRYDGNIECKFTQCCVLYDYLSNDELGTYVPSIRKTGYWVTTKFKTPLCKPPTPPPPKCDCMDCCCSPNKSDDALLKLILKRIGTLPVQVPASYLTKAAVQPANTKTIESLTDFIAWFAERFDETIGEFEISVQINDPENSGKNHTVRLPNLAEAVAEMFTMMVHTNMNSDLILNIANRTLIESGQIKQTDFKIFSALNAVIDYMGFHTDTGVEEMPLLFKPGELSFSKLLKEFKQDVSILKYTGKETLAANLQTLLQAAAIIRAMHYRKTPGSKANVASVIKKDLMDLLGESGNLSDQVKAFINNIEKISDGIDNKTSK